MRVASTKDIAEGKPFCVKVGDKALALFKTSAGYAAIDNLCPHAGGPLCEGALKNDVVTCPWHGSQFNIETGELVHGPAKIGVKTYPVEIRGEEVFVALNQDAADNKPKAVVFSFTPAFDKEHPFANEDFLNELLKALKFPFKLYGVLPFVVIAQNPDEMDLHLGEVHVTEADLQTLSGIVKTTNKKWKTDVTFCLFLSTQFPGVMLLNVRGPHAPMSLENTITF